MYIHKYIHWLLRVFTLATHIYFSILIDWFILVHNCKHTTAHAVDSWFISWNPAPPKGWLKHVETCWNPIKSWDKHGSTINPLVDFFHPQTRKPEGPTRAAARRAARRAARCARAAARWGWAGCFAPGRDSPCHSPGRRTGMDWGGSLWFIVMMVLNDGWIYGFHDGSWLVEWVSEIGETPRAGWF